jgi:hypothetical protein
MHIDSFSYGRLPFLTVEDVSDLWLNVKESFEWRVPVKKACLNNKARNPVFVDNLPAEFIQTTDSRLRSRFPQEQYLFWFREPYATVVLVACEVLPNGKMSPQYRMVLVSILLFKK